MTVVHNTTTMRIEAKIIILLLILNLFSVKGISQEISTKDSRTEFDFSKIDKYRDSKLKGQIINDYDSIFSPSEENELSTLLYNYDIETTRQIVVVTVQSIEPYSNIQKFTTDLANYWGVGTKEKNNGLTIVLCTHCREIWIGTGRGTELILTNEICKEVIDQTIIPAFKNGEYYKGIKNGVIELIEKWE